MAWDFNAGADNNVHADSIGGAIAGARSEQGLYEASTTQNYPLGQRRAFEDGRVYRYAHFAATANRGTIQSQDVSVSSSGVIDGKATAAAIGAKTVVLTDTDTFTTADVAEVYAGGYLNIEDDAGEGYIYRISDNEAGTAAGVMTLNLYDGLVAALTTDTDVAIVGNMYKNLRPASTTDPLVSGVAVRTMAAGEYGWVQTWGASSVLLDILTNGKATIGAPYSLSDGVAGAAQPMAGVASNVTINAGDLDTVPVGYLMHAGTTAAHAAIFLQIAP